MQGLIESIRRKLSEADEPRRLGEQPMEKRKIKGYGWIPELPSKKRNESNYSVFHKSQTLPPLFDLRPKCPPVYDQGQLGSCTGNGVAACVQFIQPTFIPSRLFIYYGERDIEGDVNQDGGAQIHDGIQVVHTIGCCSETEWPYDISQFAVKPSQQCYTDAQKDLITNYFSLETIEEIKQCLFAGFPVVFGTTVYESFESVGSDGIVPEPGISDPVAGGHCMVIVGYNDQMNKFIVRNSWGEGFGVQGYCYIDYSYIEQYASDFWTIRG